MSAGTFDIILRPGKVHSISITGGGDGVSVTSTEWPYSSRLLLDFEQVHVYVKIIELSLNY